MSKQDNNRYKALFLLSEGKVPKDIAEELDISYATACRYKNEFEQAKVEGTIKQLLDFPAAILDDIGEYIQDKSPITIDNETNAIVEGVKGLQKLQEDFQLTAEQISRRVRTLVMSVESAGELADLTDCLCKMQTAFFNSNSVQLNIQNNVSSQEDTRTKYAKHLSDRPQD